MGKTPGEIWRLPPEERRIVLAGIEYDFEQRAKAKGGEKGGR